VTDYLRIKGTAFPDQLDDSKAWSSGSRVFIEAGAGADQITIHDGAWVNAGSGDDTITGVGSGVFGMRFDDAPKAVLVRADWGRVEDDGYGNRDQLRGVNAFIGSAFNDTIVGSNANEFFGSLEEVPQGSDSYVGGGGYDTVFYGAKFSDFQLEYADGANRIYLTYTPAGTRDVLENISTIQFVDRVLELRSKVGGGYTLVYGGNAESLDNNQISATLATKWGDLWAGGGDDSIRWRSGAVRAGAGNDTIEFSGGDKEARANYDENPSAVRIDLQNQYAIDGWGGRDSFVNVRAVRGSSYADTITGSSGDDWIDDPYGGDTIDGGGGNDTIWFWTDRKNYLTSFDETTGLYTIRWDQDRGYFSFKNVETIRIAAPGQSDRNLSPSELVLVKDQSMDLTKTTIAGDVVLGGAGSDKIVLSAGKWAMGGAGYDQIQGYGYGSFGIRFDNSPKAVTVRADWGRVEDDGFGFKDALQGVNAFFGSRFSDYIRGSWIDESFGSPIDVSEGNDTYIGGGGYDVLLYALPRSAYAISYDSQRQAGTVTNKQTGSVDSIEQITELRFKDASVQLQSFGNPPNTLYGSSAAEKVTAEELIAPDRLGWWIAYRAGDGDDLILWRRGNVSGDRGNDTIEFSGGDKDARANYDENPSAVRIDLQNQYAIDGWGGRDSFVNVRAVRGSSYADTITGSSGDDWIDDPYGGDTIDGGGGNDTIWFWTDRKNYLTSFDETTGLYTIRWDQDRGYFSFKNVETIRIAAPGQSDRNLSPSELVLVKDQSMDLTKTTIAGDVVLGGAGSDKIVLSAGKWAMGGAGYDQIQGYGYGSFGIRFDNSPKAVTVRADWGRVEDDGFGFKDALQGVNAYIGSPFNDYINGRWADEIFGSEDQPPQGSDTYIGGGGFDVVRYFANSSDFLVTRLPDLPDGTTQRASVKYLKTGTEDYLQGIAEIQFKNSKVILNNNYPAWKFVWGDGQSETINQRTFFANEANLPWAEYWGGSGADRITWSQGSVRPGMGNDTIEVDGDSSQTTVYFDDRPSLSPGVYVNLAEGFAIDAWGDRDTLINVRRVGLTGGNDTLVGSSADDYFWDSGGNDVIDGGPGTDTYSLYLPNKGNYAMKASEDLKEILISWDGKNNQSGSVKLSNIELVRLDKGSNQSDILKVTDLINWSVQAPKALIAGDSTRWGGSKSPLGSSAEVTFSFMEKAPSYGMGGEAGSNGIVIPPTGFIPLTQAQKEVVKLALQSAAAAAGLSFRELPDSDAVQIRFGANLQTNTKGYAYLPDEQLGPIAGDVWLDAETLQLLEPGKEGFWVLLHELGHALGLVHPSVVGQVSGRAVISEAFNDTRYTVMSEKFFSPNQFPSTFSMFDVLALQYLYGPSKAGQGDTKYLIGTGRSNAMTTILDTDGYDVIDASKASTGVYIDLHGGSLLSAGRTNDDFYALFNWALGYGTEIEKLIGSDFDDIFIGTERSEWFYGRDGNDQIDGGGGLDTVQYSGRRADYDVYVSAFSGRRIVAAVDGESGADSLRDIERLIFSDSAIAYDLDGAAGDAARMIATVFGVNGLANPSLVKFALSAYDEGVAAASLAERLMALPEYSKLWLDRSDSTVLTMLFKNVVGRVPTEMEYQQLLPIFKIAPQGAVVALVAELPALDEVIGLVGLSSSGIGFGP